MNKKIKILAIVSNLGAVAQVRIVSPLEYLAKKGYVDLDVVNLSKEENNAINYVPDIVVIQRIHNMGFYDFISLLKSKGSKIIYELDDNLLEIPRRNPSHSIFEDPNHRRGFLEYIWLADHITVSTESLKNYYQKYNKNITVIPNEIDEKIFKNKKVKKTNKDQIRIGFAGTTTHAEDFEQVEPALKELQAKYADKIKLVFFNMIPNNFAADPNVEYIPGTGTLKEFSKKLKEADFDIGLAPLSFNKFNMAKSDIKFLEYGISGFAGVYSNFGPYKRTIKNNETGLLVNFENKTGWFDRLSHLIENPSEIDKLKNNAFNYVSKKRTIKLNYKNWLNVYSSLLGEKTIIAQQPNEHEELNFLPKEEIEYSSNEINTSIITLTYNQLKYTKEFVESVIKNTTNYELIIVDNNSTDGTREYLKKMEDENDKIIVILNSKNEGFPKAVNQGILAASAANIVVANNDIVVTEGWLDKMIDASETNSNIGIVGPISNSVSGVQLDKKADYKSIDEMHKYANLVSEENKGQIEEFPRVAFLCTLIKKEVIEKIGGLDERFTPGNFEDDDFCLRAQKVGYKTIIAKDVFIHHYGSVSFKNNGNNEYAERLKINENKFVEKWGSNPEGIWLKGEITKVRKIDFPINADLFIQSISRAFINIDDEEYDFALENLKLSLENYDSSPRSGFEEINKEELLNISGTIALSKNELDDAKNYFEEELKNNPNSSNACFGLGEVFIKAKMLQESKTMYEWAIVNNSENKNAMLRLKEVNTKLNLSEEHNSLLVDQAENN